MKTIYTDLGRVLHTSVSRYKTILAGGEIELQAAPGSSTMRRSVA